MRRASQLHLIWHSVSLTAGTRLATAAGLITLVREADAQIVEIDGA